MPQLRVVLLAVLAVMTTVGCGGPDTPGGSDAAVVPDGGTPDAASPPDGGAIGAGHRGSGSVAGGVKAQSPNFKLVGTMGKGDGTSSSPSFRHRGGVIGGTQP